MQRMRLFHLAPLPRAMSLRVLFLFLLLLPFCLCSSRCPIRLPNGNSSSASPRIVNGDPVFSDLLPYLVALQFPDGGLWRTFCTGTLISPSHVLTAAHCEVRASSHRVILNATSTLDSLAVPLSISDVSVHPGWGTSSAGQWDISLVHLSTSVRSSFMRVNVNADIPGERAWTRVAGYGVLYEGEDAMIDRPLMQVDVPVVGIGTCQRVYNGVDGVQIAQLVHVCAGYGGGGCDSCQGDSGGPMIQYDVQQRPVLVGVVSSGVGCARAGIPGVYVRVAAVEDWLDQVIQGEWNKSRNNVQLFRPKWSKERIIGVAVAAGVAAVVVVAVMVMWVLRKRNG